VALAAVGILADHCGISVGRHPFLLANLYKIREGGWLPLLASGLVFIIMSTWSNGRRNLIDRLREDTESLDAFFDHLDQHPPVRYRVPVFS